MFLQVCAVPFLDSATADWLSQCKTIGAVGGEVSDPARVHSHTASFMVCAAATYSASIVDRATIGCFLELQVTTPPPMWNA